mgnify:CR=1 FL=1
MGKAFQLEIITPNDPFYKGSAESVILPAIDGEYGVLAGHEPGTARYLVDGEWKEVVVGQGFAEIMPDYTILLVATADRLEDIDKVRAQRAKEHAEERMRQKKSIHEYYRSKATLARAMARLKAAEEKNR